MGRAASSAYYYLDARRRVLAASFEVADITAPITDIAGGAIEIAGVRWGEQSYVVTSDEETFLAVVLQRPIFGLGWLGVYEAIALGVLFEPDGTRDLSKEEMWSRGIP